MTSKFTFTHRFPKVSLVLLTAVVASLIFVICVYLFRNINSAQVVYTSKISKILKNNLYDAAEQLMLDKLGRQNESQMKIANREELVKPLKRNLKQNRDELSSPVEPEKFGAELLLRLTTNFRQSNMEYWDPYPEYEFHAFGRNFHMILNQDGFMEPNILITHMSKNTSTQQHLGTSPNCYYSGYLKGEPNSRVTVNLCNGMQGRIRSKVAGTYSIEPADTNHTFRTTFNHILRKVSMEGEISSSHGKYCATIGESHYDSLPPIEIDAGFENETSIDKKRRRRSADEYTIELLVVVDRKVADFHGTGLEHYILMLMKEVQELFKDNSIGNRINLVPVRLIRLEDDDVIKDKFRNNTVMLESFCEWQHKINDHDYNSPNHHDSALLITRDVICSYDRRGCESFLGLAQIGGVCHNRSYRSCAAVRDSGINTVFTVAHEIGHILNMPHDEDEQCARFRTVNEPNKIMSQTANKDSDQWTWSACSRHFLTEYLEQENVDCLHNSPFQSYGGSTSDELPGKKYSLDEQCELIYGKGWTHCQIGDEVCNSLWCNNPVENLSCRTEGPPWADGTPCASNKWCQRRKCVSMNHVKQVVDGGWAEWQPYSSCSRTCGGGIRKSYRSCNNPKNENGGEYCKGRSVRYESCNIGECPAGIADFRAQQCAKYNNSSTQWEPAHRSLDHDRCKLYCKETHDVSAYKFLDKVIDGTRCDNETSFGVCVNGRCRVTGCDHILDSHLNVDSCGVCGGNNSTCKLVRKEFSREATVGYRFIDTIPAGASKIDIQQFSIRGSHLALKDTETKTYILNGYNSVSPYAKEVFFGDFKIDYGGSLQNPERISTRSLSRLPKDLILEIYSSSNAPSFKVVYQYMIPVASSDLYRWEVTNEWSKCNNICYGDQEKLIRCVRKETGSVVYSESCAGLSKPQSETRICNDHCTLRWEVIDRSECSSHCGPGIRKLTHRCYTEHHNGRHDRQNVSDLQYLPDIQCSHIEKPSDTESCEGTCDRIHWRYSEWGPCSVSCGRGIQRRHAMCVDESNQPIDESVCSAVEKKTENVCLMEDCPDWRSEDWSQCSVSCGQGEQKRRVWCVQNNRIVSANLCPHHRKPQHLKSCEMPPCPRWIASEWSKCSVSCGIGTVVRTVRCSVPDESLCPPYLRPAETENCSLYPCQDNNDIEGSEGFSNDYQWRTGAWTKCSVTCGKGVKQRNVKCYNSRTSVITKDEYCPMFKAPPAIEPCQEKDCPQWLKSPWSSCSVTCGRGTSLRNVWCEDDEKRVPDAECQESKPAESKICDMMPCIPTPATTSEILPVTMAGSWRFGRWGECSVSCGGGIKVRNVVCLDDRGGTVSNCADHLRPASSSPCNTQPCLDQVQWKFGDWSQCNQTCGGGYQRRQVQCVSNTGENVQDAYCSQGDKPAMVRECENTACSKIVYMWKSSSWNECSVSCGSGVYTRSVQCYKVDEYNVQSTEIVADSYCRSEKPQWQKECQKEACFSYRWRTGPWSECSVSCGTGMQKRWTDCERVSAQDAGKTDVVDAAFCDKATRPQHHQECERTCIDEYTWVPGPWGECHGPCAQRKKKRKLYCYHRGKNVHRSNCKHLVKPKRRRRCTQQKCDPVSCLDIKLKYKAGRDREYVINILGRNISIYCHEMWSSHPKEYLSLAVGTSENYSEYYSKRLKDPDMTPCPNRRSKVIREIEENYNFAGKTLFRKLRLNVTSMQILMSDYTFTSTQGFYPIPAGLAGDCYSKRNCTQGSFSINVSGTGLRIAQSVQWEKVGNNANMDVKFYHERRKVIGKCGGYCGSCRPIHGLKLDVLPP